MDGWIRGWANVWMDECMDGLMNGLLNGWIRYEHSHCTRLEKAQKEQRIIADDKHNLEKKLKDEIKMAKVAI